jgi:hypothetical protein
VFGFAAFGLAVAAAFAIEKLLQRPMRVFASTKRFVFLGKWKSPIFGGLTTGSLKKGPPHGHFCTEEARLPLLAVSAIWRAKRP